MVQHTVRYSLADALAIGGRQLATVAYGAALGGMAVSLGMLFVALARAAQRRLGEFNTQDLATMAWAFAKVDRPDALLFAALARAAERRLGEFNA